MTYFCHVHLQSTVNQEKSFFLILDNENGEVPSLTKEQLVSTHQYIEFRQKYKPKKITMVDYVVYSTECEIYASTQDEDIQILINNNKAEKIAQSELRIEHAKEKNIGSKKRKYKKNTPVKTVAISGIVLVFGVCTFGVGKIIGRNSVPTIQSEASEKKVNADGMIIPVQQEVLSDAEQITITIDRSYSAVPTDDIQLKGEVIDGTAQITLPEFDKTDFFSHVPGYTYGFSSNPNATKIEYFAGKTYSFDEDVKLYRVLVKYGGGSGTKEDPYIIDYYDQLELIGQEKARGYFKQVADITFPSYQNHTPIDTVNELKSDPNSERFLYDGGGYCINNLSAPLFGKVSGAIIKDVNIKSSTINTQEHKDLAFIVCSAFNYHYVTDDGTAYETGETLIKHCSVSHSSITAEYPKEEETTQEDYIVTAPVVVPPDVIEYDENGNVIEQKEDEVIIPSKKGEHSIGAITAVGGQIEDCYVTDVGIYANLDDCFLYAGGISGKPANVINSGVYFFSATGNIFTAGGITGNAGGAKMYDAKGEEYPEYYGGNIQGCVARKIILATELTGGGITGEATSNNKNAVISNCYANEFDFRIGIYDKEEKLLKAGSAGGIIGADGKEKYGHTIMNTVSLVNFDPIGDCTLSKYDDSVRIAPYYAFFQENILTVINKNTIDLENPKEIFTGDFKFSDKTVFGDETDGALSYPSSIEDLFTKTIIENADGNDNQ